MFKNFTPKEHIAGNAPMKSSAQRQIRAKVLEQIPFLSHPAALPPPSATSVAPAPTQAQAPESDEEEEDTGARRKKGAGKEKKGKGPGGGGKGGKKNKRGGGGGRDEDDEPTSLPAQPPLSNPEEETTAAEVDENLTVLDLIWPKKETLSLVKCRDHISIYAVNGEPLFFQHFDGPFYPTLKVLHRFPDMLPRVGVDRGAIKFVLAGANIMCPGMTSPTGYLPPTSHNIPSGSPVAVHAYGKEHALAIGLLAMSTDEIRSVNKNIGVENVTFLGDDLWKVDRL
ncbi:hypothetical protein JCM10908_000641 [Rhodotorula pacifica]|uniref:translation machinery-associated protein 20 n=1 Tax=Rhodotorula pacifica TaxID=1495444 RepID=UPI0031719904